MTYVIKEAMKKHAKNIERAKESRYGLSNAFAAYLLVALEKAKEAELKLQFANPFNNRNVPSLTIEGDKVTEYLGSNEKPQYSVSKLNAMEYIMKEVGSANARSIGIATRQIERTMHEVGKRITKKEVRKKLKELEPQYCARREELGL